MLLLTPLLQKTQPTIRICYVKVKFLQMWMHSTLLLIHFVMIVIMMSTGPPRETKMSINPTP